MQSSPRVAGTTKVPALVIEIGPISQDRLEACARVFARLAVERALRELGLDSGPTCGDDAAQTTRNGPAGADNTDEAKERVT